MTTISKSRTTKHRLKLRLNGRLDVVGAPHTMACTLPIFQAVALFSKCVHEVLEELAVERLTIPSDHITLLASNAFAACRAYRDISASESASLMVAAYASGAVARRRAERRAQQRAI